MQSDQDLLSFLGGDLATLGKKALRGITGPSDPSNYAGSWGSGDFIPDVMYSNTKRGQSPSGMQYQARPMPQPSANPLDPEMWEVIKSTLARRDPQLAKFGGGQLPTPWEDMANAIGGQDLGSFVGQDLQSLASSLAGLVSRPAEAEGQVQYMSPYQSPQRQQPRPAPQPGQAPMGTVSPLVNWQTPAPPINDRFREMAADLLMQKRPGYPLNNVNPYADDPFARYR
jgi:hypothetical protein